MRGRQWEAARGRPRAGGAGALTAGDRRRGEREGREREQERARSNMERISLLVRNIGDRTDSRDLREAFERYGHVKDVYIPTDFYTK